MIDLDFEDDREEIQGTQYLFPPFARFTLFPRAIRETLQAGPKRVADNQGMRRVLDSLSAFSPCVGAYMTQQLTERQVQIG